MAVSTGSTAPKDGSRLHSFEHHIEDMRSHTTCKICLKPFYEPFILACGHTFCYSCLRSWFGVPAERRKVKNCPDCRAVVESMPCPNYILRDLVHLFVSRAELLPEDESVEEHTIGKSEEAALLATDRAAVGLFRGLFKSRSRNTIGIGPIIDHEDHVDRCPQCAWELEDRFCNHCGWGLDDSDDLYEDGFTDAESLMDHGSIATAYEDEGDEDHSGAPPRQFYGIESDAESHMDDSEDMDDYEQRDPFWDRPERHHLDEDLEDFIDDDEDITSEIDDDGMGIGPQHMPGRFIESEDNRQTQSGDEDDEDDVVIRPSMRRNVVPISSASQTEDGTQYDSSGDNESTIQELPRRRRQQVILSDDEEEEEEEKDSDEDGHDQNEDMNDNNRDSSSTMSSSDTERSSSAAPSVTGTDKSSSEVNHDHDHDDDGQSSDSTMHSTPNPVQSAASRRQRLEHQRARRPNNHWRPSGRTNSAANRTGHQAQPARLSHAQERMADLVMQRAVQYMRF